MSERPILFHDEMVRAILANRKTQMRRPMKPQPFEDNTGCMKWQHGHHVVAVPSPRALDLPSWAIWKEAPWHIGDLLWVREAFETYYANGPNGYEDPDESVAYRADNPSRFLHWRPSIHMPRWASRITLRITDVKVERLQDSAEEVALYGWPTNSWVWAVTFRREL